MGLRTPRLLLCGEGLFILFSPVVADGAGDGVGGGADEADGVQELVGLDLAEHADAADGVAYLARHIVDGRGDRAKANFVFAVFHGVALLADAGELGGELLRRGEGVGRVGLELGVREDAAALGRGAVGQKQLALRRAVDRQTRADLGDHAQARAGFLLRERHDGGAVKDRQEDALAELGADVLHVRPGDGTDVPRVGDGAAVFKQPDAQPVAAVRRLLDEAGLAHGGEQAVDGALRPAGLLIQLC